MPDHLRQQCIETDAERYEPDHVPRLAQEEDERREEEKIVRLVIAFGRVIEIGVAEIFPEMRRVLNLAIGHRLCQFGFALFDKIGHRQPRLLKVSV